MGFSRSLKMTNTEIKEFLEFHKKKGLNYGLKVRP